MKFGMRKPSIKRSLKAKTTGKVKRKAKSAINPLYGQKGMGWAKDPKKAAYNKVYKKTSFGWKNLFKWKPKKTHLITVSLFIKINFYNLKFQAFFIT